MKNVHEVFSQIEALETDGSYRKAQSLREKLLREAENARDDAHFLLVVDTLVQEKTTVRSIEESKKVEPYYRQLHDLAEKRLGRDHALAGLAKRKLARIFIIQGRDAEGIAIVEEALPILRARFGDDSYELREATVSLLGWYKRIDPARAAEMNEQLWQAHPLCDHLKPIEKYLAAHRTEMRRNECDWPNVKVTACAYLDVDSIQQKLPLNPCVEVYEDPPAPHSWDLKGFCCKMHGHIIAGSYEPRAGEPTIS